jgi:hypothetical protein
LVTVDDANCTVLNSFQQGARCASAANNDDLRVHTDGL